MTLTLASRVHVTVSLHWAESSLGHGELTMPLSMIDCPTLRTSNGSPLRRPHSPSLSATL